MNFIQFVYFEKVPEHLKALVKLIFHEMLAYRNWIFAVRVFHHVCSLKQPNREVNEIR